MLGSSSSPAAAQTGTSSDPATGRVLDIEKRRVVDSLPNPSDAGPTADVLIVGGGTGGVAAAEALARRGLSVILMEPTSVLGGQFTSQVVPAPDENSHIEKQPGPSTASYRALRERVRAHYRAVPEVKPTLANNVGQCWVSRVSGTPDVWAKAIDERLDQLSGNAGVKRVYRRHQIRNVSLLANGRFNYADLVDLDTGRVSRVGARYLLDATEDGSALALAGCPTVIGQEGKGEFAEPHAPDEAHPEWVQSFTYCFVVRWQEGATAVVERPAEYDHFKSVGEYTLDYVYSDARGTVTYKVLEKVPGAGGPFWTYRRLLASSSFQGGKSPVGDVSLINWRGNDFNEDIYLGKPLEEQARVLERGRAFAQGFLHWLQTECPRDDGKGIGYPEMQPTSDLPGMDGTGFALAPYIRESRRLRARFTLNENHLLAPPSNPAARWGEEFPDSVGCALYSVDIHPTKGEPHLLTPALPYHIPLGSFLPASGPTNVLPAAKNFGATRLALASARMHPTEWLVGEVAGSLAAFCIRRDIDDPSAVRDDPALLSAFQQDLKDSGVALSWREILPPPAAP
jgi:hypothetical protein